MADTITFEGIEFKKKVSNDNITYESDKGKFVKINGYIYLVKYYSKDNEQLDVRFELSRQKLSNPYITEFYHINEKTVCTPANRLNCDSCGKETNMWFSKIDKGVCRNDDCFYFLCQYYYDE